VVVELMDTLHNLQVGFDAALGLQSLGFCLVGVLLGTLIGVLPGIGPLATIAMLLPITFELDTLGALIMLAGIYYGAQYGGSTAAILVNMPGESSSVVTALDGYQMARQGRAGSALTVAALASLLAGCVGTLFIAAFAPALAAVSQRFQSPEYFALMLFGLVAAVVLAQGSIAKALAMTVLGLSFGLIGTDVTSGTVRFTFGIPQLFEGVDFVVVAMGLFGLAEVLRNLERGAHQGKASAIGSLWPTRAEAARAWPAALRGTLLGSLLGILPGGGAILSSFASYVLEKRISNDPSQFGKGAIEGVAGPEAANNAGAQTSFIPLLTLGIPSNPVIALLMGAMIIKGITPGTAVMNKEPLLFWGLIASMWIGNFMLVLINLPLVGLWVRLLRIPYRWLFPCIVVLCCVGVYSVNNSTAAVAMTAGFAALGYLFAKLGCESAPFILGFVLGSPMEENLRRSMQLANGDPAIFIHRPICAALIAAAVIFLIVSLLPTLRRGRDHAFGA
jgi:putative tricarboxylic transport membrane protein